MADYSTNIVEDGYELTITVVITEQRYHKIPSKEVVEFLVNEMLQENFKQHRYFKDWFNVFTVRLKEFRKDRFVTGSR